MKKFIAILFGNLVYALYLESDWNTVKIMFLKILIFFI